MGICNAGARSSSASSFGRSNMSTCSSQNDVGWLENSEAASEGGGDTLELGQDINNEDIGQGAAAGPNIVNLIVNGGGPNRLLGHTSNLMIYHSPDGREFGGRCSFSCHHLSSHMRPHLVHAHVPIPQPAPRHPPISGTCVCIPARPAPPSRFRHMRPHLIPPRASLAFRAHAPMPQPAPRHPRV